MCQTANPLINIECLVLRWRLQKALFTPSSVGWCGCAGISFRDFFLSCPTCRQANSMNLDPDRPLTLEDLENVKPIFISNTVINRWRRTTFPTEPDYEALIMSPQGIERLDRHSSRARCLSVRCYGNISCCCRPSHGFPWRRPGNVQRFEGHLGNSYGYVNYWGFEARKNTQYVSSG